MVQTQFQTNIQILRKYFEKNDIVHQSSCNDIPQQNEMTFCSTKSSFRILL